MPQEQVLLAVAEKRTVYSIRLSSKDDKRLSFRCRNWSNGWKLQLRPFGILNLGGGREGDG